jgi:hypothetical protein
MEGVNMSKSANLSKRYGCLTMIIGLLVGVLSGYTISSIRSEGYFIKWKNLTNVPTNFLKFEASRESALFVTTSDDKFLAWGSDHWEEVEGIPSDISDHWNIIAPCERKPPQFSFLTNAPQNVIDCIQDEGVYAEFYNKHVYALDEEGVIWEWHLLNHGFSVLANLLVSIFIFGIAGLLISIILIRIWKRYLDDKSYTE